MYAITRRKAALTAWYWAVYLRRRGKLHYKQFYDRKHGGSREALATAIVWRDVKLAQTRPLTHREFHQQVRSNNTSGVPGVHFLKTAKQPQGNWQAKIKLPTGRMTTKAFSVRKFGRRRAFEHAVAARNEMLLAIEDRPYLKHSTAMRFAARQQGSNR